MDLLLYIYTPASLNSKWTPWELGCLVRKYNSLDSDNPGCLQNNEKHWLKVYSYSMISRFLVMY